jgi:hypothetical protein
MENKLAPICFFTYNRLEETKKTVCALQQNNLASKSELYIFSDGWKSELGREKIQNVRSFLKTITGFKTITIFESSINKGLANSIIDGVTQVINKHGKVIVLEDDLITSPNFLDFMNQALTKYKAESEIISISGHTLDFKIPKGYEHDVYFFGRAGSWGWGTWQDKWDLIDWEIKDWNSFIKDKYLIKKFNLNGNDLFPMLKGFQEGKNNSWAIRFCYNQFKLNKLSVYPCISKLDNIGFSDEATNCKGYNRYKINFKPEHISTFNYPDKIKINNLIQKKIRKHLGLYSRIKSRLLTFYYKALN